MPLIYDDLTHDPRMFLRQVFSFLDVDIRLDLPSVDRIIGFPRPEEPDTLDADIEKGIEPDMRERLRMIFADQISLLEELLKRDLSIWR